MNKQGFCSNGSRVILEDINGTSKTIAKNPVMPKDSKLLLIKKAFLKLIKGYDVGKIWIPSEFD